MLWTMKIDVVSSLYALVVSILGILSLISLCHHIPKIGWLNYIGTNSIIFYFLSGGVPAIWGIIFKYIFPDPSYIVSILVASISVITVFPITYFINQYCPIVTDLFYKKK